MKCTFQSRGGWMTTVTLIALNICYFSAHANAGAVNLRAASSSGQLAADRKQNTFLKVTLKGAPTEANHSRPALNATIVLDCSGSMGAQKIDQAKQAAQMFVKGLQPEDIISIVLYSDTVDVLVPATKARDKDQIISQIGQIMAGGSTALFAGVSKGAAEVRKFLGKDRINRVVLLSDGLANIGPSSPSDLAALGASLVKEGISVTTLGLGEDYNEDLMTQLALRSDGNHAFIDKDTQLAKIFEAELGSMLEVVAKDVDIHIRCAEGIRPVRVLGREAEIDGQDIRLRLNQIYSNYDRNVVLEVEVPSSADGSSRDLATADISYLDLNTNARASQTEVSRVSFSKSEELVKNSLNRDVMVSVVVLLSTAENLLATQLRDAGKIEEARRQFSANSLYLKQQNEILQDKDIDALLSLNDNAAKNLEPQKWKAQRKFNAELGTTSNGDVYRLKQ